VRERKLTEVALMLKTIKKIIPSDTSNKYFYSKIISET